ncbi:TPR-like protein [Imleria badia]|nr:TPR-like protein [Imleria badia]
MRESSFNAGILISVPDPSSDIHHVLVHNALVRVRSENWSSAYEDAQKSIVTRPSAMGYIAKVLAQIGMGEPEESMQVFDLAFKNCNPQESNLLLLIKAIILFVARKYDTAISRVHDLIAVSGEDETTYCCIQVLGKMYLMQGDYARAVKSLERGHVLASSCTGSDLETISFIFGWTFDKLQITVQRYLCEDLYASGRAAEAAEALRKITGTFGEEIRASKVTADWVMDLKRKCIDTLELLGDTALESAEHDNAIAGYTSALSLDPSKPINILVKRSKARASKGLWEDALMDSNEVIKRDPSSHMGYERKYAALHGAQDYGEAINALLHMLSVIESSPDEEIRRLRANYTVPSETITAVDTVIHEIFKLCPLVLIDIKTGRLCNAQERIEMFKSETPFKKIVSETATRKIDRAHIRQSVAKYFKWIMFSHTWEGKEPTLKDVNIVDSVWKLDDSPLHEKLRQFCKTASEDGYRWAWSDTCCIDKDTSAILSQSLIAMYMWYEKAAETLVYLADVLSSAELADLALTNSRWMTRAWTLQELLASKVVRFYNRDWKLYLNDTNTNHKESPAIKQELAQAIGIAPGTITSFQPEDLGVREKLRLASTRNATVEEDIAYSLIGIFSSNIVPRYGLGKTALGELLENILARTGDVTVIAWTGTSLPYNSALPASLEVYSQVPYSPPPMEGNELDTCVEQLRTQSSLQDALAFYYRVTQLARATFSNRCLQLPCIAFYVTKIGVQELGGNQGTLYRATVSSLGKVEFRTADVMPLKKPRKLVFVHPWLRDLYDTLDGFVSEDERETESDVGSSDEAETESNAGSGDATDDASAPASPLHAEPSARVDPSTLALQLIARLGRPFNALLLEQQSNNQYKRVAAEEEIIVPGVPHKTNLKDIKVKVLEIV